MNPGTLSAFSPDALAAGPAADEDLSALAWVQEELRRSLDAAHKALRRQLREQQAAQGSDVDDTDPAVLRAARQALHQGTGALELVGLPEAAAVLRTAEAAVQRRSSQGRRLDAEAVETVERASFALLDYLSRRLAGKAPSALGLFPAYRGVAELAELDRIHPADLWTAPWAWHDLAPEDGVQARPVGGDLRRRFEQQLLAMLRGESRSAPARMSDLCAELAAGSGDANPQVGTLWRLASAFFEAQARGLLDSDTYTKRIGSRLLAQLRALERGEGSVSERLAQDLLFFCSQARLPAGEPAAPGGRGEPPGVAAPRLAAVRQSFHLPAAPPVSYAVSRLGRFDPAWLAQARKRVAAAKDSWSAVAAGEGGRAALLAEQFLLVGDSLRRLYPGGDLLADSLQQAALRAVAPGQVPGPGLAMEVATSLLYLEASLEDGELDHPTLPERVRRLSERVLAVTAGDETQPLEPWMEDLYRSVSDRQTMGSVVQELRSSLAEVERAIDDFFRDPNQRGALLSVPTRLGSMRGVLSVLGIDAADRALVDMREEVDELIADPRERTAGFGGAASPQSSGVPAPQAARFARLAGNLGALGFLIDMLGVQPQMARSLFVYDATSRTLNPLMGRMRREPVADRRGNEVQPELLEQAQVVASQAASGEMALEEVSRELDRLGRAAQMDDRAGLAASVSRARAALADAHQASDTDEDRAQDARERIADALSDFVSSASTPLDDGLGSADAPPPIPAAGGAGAPPANEDEEMRAVFLEEAQEVIGEIEAAQMQLVHTPADMSLITTVRRGFHTLKGSSRMVGLRDFGDAAWAGEQLYNTLLAEQRPVEEALQQFTGFAVGHLAQWVADIAAGRSTPDGAGRMLDAAALVKAGVVRSLPPEVSPAPAPAPAPAPVDTPIDMPVDTPVDAPSVLERALSGFGLPLDLPSAEDLELAVEPVPPGESGGGASFQPATETLSEAPSEAPSEASLGSQPEPSLQTEPLAAEPSVEDPSSGAPLAGESPAELPLAEELTAHASVADEFQQGTPPLLEPSADDLPVLVDVQDTLNRPPQALTHAPTLTEVVLEGEEAVEPPPEVELRQVGDLRVPAPLFNIYLNEADELSRSLTTEIAEWAMDPQVAVGDAAVALAHSLGGSSATVGYGELSALSRKLERTLSRVNELGSALPSEARLFVEAAEEIRRMLHQFAAGFLVAAPNPLSEGLADVEQALLRRLAERDADAAADADAEVDALADANADADAGEASGYAPMDDPHGVHDAVDDELFPIFDEEASELLPQLSGHLRDWQRRPTDPAMPAAALRDLHTFKGGARLAGAMRMGEMAHQLEADVEALAARGATPPDIEALQMRADALNEALEALRAAHSQPSAGSMSEPEAIELALRSRLGDFGSTVVPAHPLAPAPVATPAPAPTPDPTPNPAPTTTPAMQDTVLATLPATLFATLPLEFPQGATELPSADARLPDATPTQAEGTAPGTDSKTTPETSAATSPATAPADWSITQPIGPEWGRTSVFANPFATPQGPDLELPAPAELQTEPQPQPEPEPDLQTEPHPAPMAEADTEAEADVQPPADAPSDADAQPARVAPAPAPLPDIDWTRFTASREALRADEPPSADRQPLAASAVRVRTPVLERMVGLSGEVSVTRSRIEQGVQQMRSSLTDLTDNLLRLREQLRDIEVQAETQMSSRREAARAAAQAFDPLEFDRFTRFQEITRMMAESVNDVGTVHRNLQRAIESTEDELAAQARLTRELQDDLLRTRMVEFDGLAERLHRVVRQAAKETGKQVRLDIVGGTIEVDRGVLDRMTPAFEHLLRNSVAHGIELPEARAAAGKPATGTIAVSLAQEGNDVSVEFRDDGAGLDLARIRERGLATGLLSPGVAYADAEVQQLIYAPGFSTVTQVTGLAGRGIGMDVVRAEVNALGGRIETLSTPAAGTTFRLVLPLTTAVTQVLMLRCGAERVAVPATLVELVRRVDAAEIERAYASGTAVVASGAATLGDGPVPFFWLGALLQLGGRSSEAAGRTRPMVIIRSAQQRVALHVDEVVGTQEVVVKNLGQQLARLPGLGGMSVLASGDIALIYNPVALATAYGSQARSAMQAAVTGLGAAPDRRGRSGALEPASAVQPLAPLVLVVDDSLTVRRVTQRLLQREGYRVSLAKDGLEALERLAEERPTVLLSDIEMPRMDGFDLVRNLRGDARLRSLPVIMITSRIAQKHRDYAAELGVDHYLGKPYAEDDLLALVGRYARVADTLI